jgi:hypothetical protein
MGVEENKAAVRRFVENVVSGRDVSVADEVLAPDYVNLAFPDGAIAGLKAISTAVYAAVGEGRIGPLELVAEGDAVVARFDYAITLPDGSEQTSRVLTYFHLTGGRIDVDDRSGVPLGRGELSGSPKRERPGLGRRTAHLRRNEVMAGDRRDQHPTSS